MAGKHLLTLLAFISAIALLTSPAAAAHKTRTPTTPTTPAQTGTPSVLTTIALQSWMSADLAAAWASGYKGQGVTITFVDEYSGHDAFSGNVNGTVQTQLHGLWTREIGSMVAPSATIVSKDYNTSKTAVSLAKGLNVINVSYGWFDRAGYNVGSYRFGTTEKSLISIAQAGTAVVSKAAGNDSVVTGTRMANGQEDYLAAALSTAKTAIIVGALSTNGTTAKPASLASYSDTAGTNKTVQSHFLVVGVDSNAMGGLYGTSFAAPIVSGYAAILGSKFKTATPTQITNRLLTTARKDTVVNYNAATYGMGEASLANAIAPNSIN